LGAVIGLAWLCASCADGYAPNQAPRILDFSMSQQEALKALNLIAESPLVDQPIRFKSESACALQGERKRLIGWKSLRSIPLQGSKAELSKSGYEESYSVSMKPAQGGEALIMEGLPLFEALDVKWIVNHLQSLCVSGVQKTL
jgi:hypothetical protein